MKEAAVRNWAFALPLLSACAALAGPAGQTALVLDERCTARCYCQFDWDRISPAPLKAPRIEFTSQRELRGLERMTKARLAYRKIDWSRHDWRDHAVIRFVCPNAGIQPAPAAERYMNAPAPPPEWAQPDFDDSAWPRQRQPFLLGRPRVGFGVQNFGVRASFYRLPLFVPDPARAGDLELRVAYRGGVRVFVNGREVARGHLPEGPITEATCGQDYPHEAYVRLPAELSEKTRGRLEAFLGGKGRDWPAQQMLIPELFGRFEHQPHPHNRPDVAVCHRGTTSVTRAVWRRIQAARDRALEGVKIPAKLLRKGPNVLAVEVRASRFHPVVLRNWLGWGNYSWAHAQINSLQLRAPAGRVPSMLARPPGMQVWVPDVHHRVHDTEWGPRGRTGTVRFVAARNGTYSAQIAVGSDRPLTGVTVTPGPLRGASGAAIPAGALSARVMRPRPLGDLAGLCGGRSKTLTDPLAGGQWALRRHGLIDVDPLTRPERIEALGKVHFFDQISAAGPAAVPAGRCRAFWLYLKVPPGARAGTYRGSVVVAAAGRQPVAVPVVAEVVNWHLPPPREFRTRMALEHSPYGVAKQYGVAPWSERHFDLLAASIRQLGRAGNDWLFVPVLRFTEFGNRLDSPIRWVRRPDGELTCDYGLLDRWLDLVVEHWGKPRVIAFVVMHGNPGNPPEISVLDAATGRVEPMAVAGASLSEADRRRLWGGFATSLYSHMKARGLAKSMFWGYAWDGEGDPTLKYLLEEFTPGVYWAMGGHALRTHPRFYRAFSWIYKVHSSMSLMHNCMGWKNPKLEFQNPRGGGSVLCLPGNAPAFGFRLAVDRALTVGTRGLGRVGADYWKESYYDGTRGGEVFLQPGMNTHVLLWPGNEGAESSGRFEALLEGLQEAEARIFLEQALDRSARLPPGRGGLPEPLAEKARKAVFDHLRSTVYIPAGVSAEPFFEYGAAGWQGRSRRLYQTAAEVAAALVLDVDRTEIVADVPARSRHRLDLKVRKWSAGRLAWKAAADQKWIKLPVAEGVAEGTFDLPVVLDGEALQPGRDADGTLTLAAGGDAGRKIQVRITARVSKVFGVSLREAVFNVPAGGSDGRELTLLNSSGREVKWQARSSERWLSASPAGGVLPAGEALLVGLTARPPDRRGAARDSTVTIGEAGRSGGEQVKVRTFVIPPYTRPALPAGQAVPLEAVEAKRLVRHGIMTHGIDLGGSEWMRSNDRNKPRIGPSMYYGWHLGSATLTGLGRKYAKALWVRPHHESVYRLAGSGYAAFAAEVGVPKGNDRPQLHRDARVCFEIHLDGRLAAHSGIMALGDPPRLLVATGLEKAREIRLVTRLDSLKDSPRSLFFWAEPRFYRKK